MSRCWIDHITVTAPTLKDGAAFVHQALGVHPQAGGEHPHMGTHNLLLRLGDGLFLEVISVNPQAAAPTRPRWFMLDSLRPSSAPSLAAWVARTSDIHGTTAACSESLGDIEPMRRGKLNWLMTAPAGGALPLGGVAPVLIEWQTEAHPSASLEDHGLSLAKLELFHPEAERISRMLLSIGFEGPLSVSLPDGDQTPGLVAHIHTPHGIRVL